MNNYKQLQTRERYLIEYLLNQENKSLSQIAKILKRNKNTIAREVKRNKLQEKYYADVECYLKSRQEIKNICY